MDGLLERDRELAALDRLLGDAADGRGRVALIEGPAGIGKSRLLAEARVRADDRMTVLTARCGELERDFSFGAVRQLLEPVADRVRLLAGAAAPAAGVLEAPGGATEGSFAVLHGLYWAVLNLAEERPVLLALDDLQWSDRPSLRFVAYLVRRLEGSPVLVAATLRSTEPGTDPALIAEIAADPLCEAVRPAPLGNGAVIELVTAQLGAPDPRFVAACREATGGNPLLLRHLIAALEQDGVAPS
jgi:predicted ATPase